MKTNLSLIAIMILGLNYAFAQETNPTCELTGVKSLSLPLYPEKADSPRFDFKYQIVGNLNPEDFVLIYLPGGPGGTSIRDFDLPEVRKNHLKAGLPENITWIMIDPRSVGCNEGDEKDFPDDSLTSTHLAHDVLALIKNLGLKKYILHGHSYGSQSATFIAGLARENNAQQPHALFLSGILGKGKADGTFSIPFNLSLEWELIKQELSPKALVHLEKEHPFEIDAEHWRYYIQRRLYWGFQYVDGELRNPFIEKLKLLESDDSKAFQSLLDEVKPTENPPFLLQEKFELPRRDSFQDMHPGDRLFAKIDCHEFSPADGYVNFSFGKLVFDEASDPCKDEPYDRPYDSADFEIESPIYYLAGTNDPAAPYEGAVHHFENQNQTRRNFMTVPRGAHSMLGYIFPDCKDDMWKAIYELKDLTEVMPKCAIKVDLKILEKN